MAQARKPKLVQGDLVQVEWADAHTVESWQSIDKDIELSKLAKCVTVGFFIRWSRDPAGIVIAHTKSDEAEICGMIVIPNAWLTSAIKKL